MTKAWAAGFLDGEGCFDLKAHARSFTPVVEAAQATYREPLDKLQSLLGGRVNTRNRRTVSGRVVYVWTWKSARELREHLPTLIPHLTVKREQAVLLLKCARQMRVRGDVGATAALTDDEIQWRVQQLAALRGLRALKEE